MKKNSIALSISVLLLFLLPLSSSADTGTSTQNLTLAVSGNALIRVDPGTNGSTAVNLSLAGATTAGAEVTPFTFNNKTRLKISTLAGEGEKRKITAENTGTSLTGSRTQLSIRLMEPNASFTNRDEGGALQTGTDEGYIMISNTTGNAAAQTLINTIGTCWSGTGAEDGYIIDYKYMATGGGTPTGKSGIVITFTIAADV